MRAWVRESYGGPGVLRLAERLDPVAGPGELLVRVHATTVNRTDLAYLTGHPRINRAFVGWPRPRAWARILGSEYAGLVEAVGPGVTSYAVGDRVCVLVIGATGAIGSALVQLLVADGVEVTTVTDQPLPVDLGARADVEGRYDAVFDAVGKTSYGASRALLTPRGSYVSSDLGRGGQNLLLALLSRRVHFPVPKADASVAADIVGRMADGTFRPLVDRTYTFDELPEAYAYVATGRKVGNVVVA